MEDKAKSRTEINYRVTSGPYELIYPICSSLDCIDFVISQSLFIIYKKKIVHFLDFHFYLFYIS
ncbi:hypothetical protein [Priestia sp. SB1]|uniref:hypothetical protein n=1 Tax=Priestia sp. SB1 TaxID=3132359 RepID=UPI00319E98E9